MVAADVSDWIPTPAPLNYNKSGKRALFSDNNSILQRQDAESQSCGSLSYTAHPLRLWQVWQTTVLETTAGWIVGGLVSGYVLGINCNIRTISATASTRVLGDMGR